MQFRHPFAPHVAQVHPKDQMLSGGTDIVITQLFGCEVPLRAHTARVSWRQKQTAGAVGFRKLAFAGFKLRREPGSLRTESQWFGRRRRDRLIPLEQNGGGRNPDGRSWGRRRLCRSVEIRRGSLKDAGALSDCSPMLRLDRFPCCLAGRLFARRRRPARLSRLIGRLLRGLWQRSF